MERPRANARSRSEEGNNVGGNMKQAHAKCPRLSATLIAVGRQAWIFQAKLAGVRSTMVRQGQVVPKQTHVHDMFSAAEAPARVARTSAFAVAVRVVVCAVWQRLALVRATWFPRSAVARRACAARPLRRPPHVHYAIHVACKHDRGMHRVIVWWIG